MALPAQNGRGRRASLADRLGLDEAKLAVIRSQIAPGAPDDVLEFYFERCRVAGADPFSRTFYIAKRRQKVDNNWVDRWMVETTIDGLRSIAESTGEYDGQDPPVFEYRPNGQLVSCTVTVFRKHMGRGISATAFFDEYVQTDKDGVPTRMWTKMQRNQTAKCAEALAMRKAFPKKLAGFYTDDEMAQSEQAPDEGQNNKVVQLRPQLVDTTSSPGDTDPPVAQESAPGDGAATDAGAQSDTAATNTDAPALAKTEQLQAIRKLALKLKLDDPTLIARIRDLLQSDIVSLDQLTEDDAGPVIKALQAHK
jgi:phage recombination protein Bet